MTTVKRLSWRLQSIEAFVVRLLTALAQGGVASAGSGLDAKELIRQLTESGRAQVSVPVSVGRDEPDEITADIHIYLIRRMVGTPKATVAILPDGRTDTRIETASEDRGLHADVILRSRHVDLDALFPVFSKHMAAMTAAAIPVPAKLAKDGWQEVAAPTAPDGTALITTLIKHPFVRYAGVDLHEATEELPWPGYRPPPEET